jgi:hypothetical protein
MRYMGLDVHYSTSTYCVLDANGQEVQCETVRGHWPKLLERLRTVAGPGTIRFEATCGYGYRYRELSRLAQRFVRSSQVGAYFGLVPCQDASAGVNRLGHITRPGPATARKYLVEAAWQGVYRSPTIRAFCERVQHGRPERRKIALVATARYLLRAARYVELNPVRAKLCRVPWRWSSAAAHVAGRDDDLVRVGPLREHVKDWNTAEHRELPLPTEEVALLRRHARTGRPLGETAFLDRIERLLHRVVRPAKPGPKPREK